MTTYLPLLLLLTPLLQPPPTSDRGPWTSLIAVLADPKVHDQRRITVDGWCVKAQEESALYLTQEDAQYLNAVSAVWLDVDVRKIPVWKDQVYWRCSVEGRLDAQGHGHLGAFPATLTDLSAVHRTRSRTKPTLQRAK